MTVYEVVTQRILDALERGVVPWHRPWTVTSQAPANLISHRCYRGINAVITWCAGYASPWWLTYRQTRELGGYVRAGEHGVPIIFFRIQDAKDEPDDREGMSEEPRLAGRRRQAPCVRYFTVFNIAQTEGLDAHVPEGQSLSVTADTRAEALIATWPQAPTIRHGYRQAAYVPRDDRIEMPDRQQFSSTGAYYSTLLHECAHATGHPSRVGRYSLDTTLAPFGSADYSREELVAELAAAFLCGELALDTEIESSTAYIEHWLKVLRTDRRLLVQLAADAERAADHIRGVSPDTLTQTDSDACASSGVQAN